MTEEFDAVLFDAGGVLWDLRPSPEDIFSEVLTAKGVSFDRAALGAAMRKADRLTDEEFAQLDTDDESGFWRRYDELVLRELGVKVDTGAFARELSAELRETFGKVESWHAFPDAVPALEAVRRRGFRTGMVSNATELARRVLRNLDMDRLFDFVVISEEVGVRKPDPRIFSIALERAATIPSRTVFLGDKPATDIKGAARAGLKGVLVDRNETFPDTPFVRIRSLDELRRFM
jgi:REG-2-like HAD superfamily hydrolase